ncbi:MAG: M48 family metallopeptidase [Candidatus Cloacimonetes bacterium]|nr:M48 family metallopeptidase [Candidatus Cloacimonadota bacterium]MCF7815030.1 M48 family metallopeptidase [Candidatus Cloacimonadota bacterium]MCF7869257.1 M48 family metallopeptidase [Candidatus Cloacimonadota bacterium]MCF7884691.1 M48 family metallopeptidase [Candidatus Cloacimonadota bacterium]
MWELIRANKIKSLVLFFVMGICLLLLGYFLGSYYGGNDGGFFGLSLALLIWGIMSLVSYFGGDSIVLAMSKAKKVTKDVHPQLFNVVEEMKIAAGLHSMPQIYIIPDPAPNAFAVGRNPEKAAIAVTAGLLAKLNRDELQGVIAHEMSHILNRDVLFMTFSGVLLGSIVLLSHIFLRSLWFGGGRRNSSSKGGGQAQMIVMIIAIVMAVLAPIMARLLYFAISRKREYLADASAVRLTRYPEGLAAALEKISNSTEDLKTANKATAGLYIANPLKKKGKRLQNLSSTHPPISERIKILRNISQGANFINYQNAFTSVKGRSGRTNIIPASKIHENHNIPLRDASEDVKPKTANQKVRETGNLIKKLNNFLFVTCLCGMKFKIPPDFKKTKFSCPRCGRINCVPTAELATLAGISDVIEKK